MLTIEDDGRGFDTAAADGLPGHLGLVSMRERAQIAGGWWAVKCPPEGGTSGQFWLPLEPEVPAGDSRMAEHAR